MKKKQENMKRIRTGSKKLKTCGMETSVKLVTIQKIVGTYLLAKLCHVSTKNGMTIQ